MKPHDLKHNNYFSKEADLEYMSVSQFKNFNKCSAKAVHDLQFDMHEEKEAFVEGSLFEALTIGDAEKFLEDHPEIVSSQSPTKGQIKANYKKVVKAADRFNEQKFFRDIISKCENQVILVGEIEGVKVKCCLDLFDLKNGDGRDPELFSYIIPLLNQGFNKEQIREIFEIINRFLKLTIYIISF